MRTGYWVGLFLACAMTATAQSMVPSSFNYQGVLRGGSGELLTALTPRVEFRLYKAAADTTVLWGRNYAVLLESNGLFNVELSDSGAVLSGLPFGPSPAIALSAVVAANPDLYLGLTVVGSSEIAPRQKLLSVPFAMMAGDVKTTSGDLKVNGFLTATNGEVRIGGAVTVGSSLKVGARIKDKTGDVMPVGTVLPFAGSTLPPGWLWCDGLLYSRITYADLYAAILATYGAGDGTTFAVPNMKGRTAIGAGTGTSLTSRALGVTLGEEEHTLTKEQMPAHSHTIQTYNEKKSYAAVEAYSNHWKNEKTALTGEQGSSLPHNNMQPSLVLNYIIKY